MYEWLTEIQPGQRVLDVCSGPGSFPGIGIGGMAIAMDEDVDAFVTAAAPARGHVRVFARSDHLPFAAASIDLVVCHHALEHVIELEKTLAEIARVLRPDGRLIVTVPNGYGLCDGVYRFVFEGGGHVNRFRRDELVAMVEKAVGVRLTQWTRLYSSFVYLWRLKQMLEDPPPGLTPRIMTIAKLPPKAITAVQHLLYSGSRVADRWLGTGLALYGWAFYFDHGAAAPVETPAYVNVCRYCGVGHPATALDHPAPGKFRCSSCNGVNPYFAPFGNAE